MRAAAARAPLEGAVSQRGSGAGESCSRQRAFLQKQTHKCLLPLHWLLWSERRLRGAPTRLVEQVVFLSGCRFRGP